MGSELIDLEEGDGLAASPSEAELERAIASVPGIDEVNVERDTSTGRTRLRLRLRPGEDGEQVAWSVAATLRERFDIALDPAAIRPVITETATEDPAADPIHLVDEPDHPDGSDAPQRGDEEDDVTRPPPPPPPAQAAADVPPSPAPPAAAQQDPQPDAGDAASPAARPAVRKLDRSADQADICITVTLEQAGETVHGSARSVPTTGGLQRAAAEATIDALQRLTRNRLVVGVDRVEVNAAEQPSTVTVLLSMVAERGEETLLGAALVRGDAETAVVRATLDALNRRVEPLLDHAG